MSCVLSHDGGHLRGLDLHHWSGGPRRSGVVAGSPCGVLSPQPRLRGQYALYVRKHPTPKPAVKNTYIPALSAGCCASGANSRASPPSVTIQPSIVTRTGQRRVHRCSLRRIETPATNRNRPLRYTTAGSWV